MKKIFANSFKNKVSIVEQTDRQNRRQTDRLADRLTLNFINIDKAQADFLIVLPSKNQNSFLGRIFLFPRLSPSFSMGFSVEYGKKINPLSKPTTFWLKPGLNIPIRLYIP